MADDLPGISRAASRLKEKLKSNKVSFDDYKLSDQTDVRPPSSEERHKVKRKKVTFYLSNEASKNLDNVYMARYAENNKIDKSTLICEAIDLLASKQKRRRSNTQIPSQ